MSQQAFASPVVRTRRRVCDSILERFDLARFPHRPGMLAVVVGAVSFVHHYSGDIVKRHVRFLPHNVCNATAMLIKRARGTITISIYTMPHSGPRLPLYAPSFSHLVAAF